MDQLADTSRFECSQGGSIRKYIINLNHKKVQKFLLIRIEPNSKNVTINREVAESDFEMLDKF